MVFTTFAHLQILKWIEHFLSHIPKAQMTFLNVKFEKKKKKKERGDVKSLILFQKCKNTNDKSSF